MSTNRPLRTEAATFVGVPGITNSFARVVSKQRQQHEFEPGADAMWIKNDSDLGYLPLSIDIPHEMIRDEIHKVTAHMDSIKDMIGEGWHNFSLYAPSDDSDVMEGASHWRPLAMDLMPRTVAWFMGNWPCAELHRMRLLALAPGGYIGLHSDDCQGLDNINIAIDHPQGCEFYLDGSGIIPFQDGRAFLVNTGRKHAVINHSDRVRYHITMYQTDDAAFRDLIVRSYQDYASDIS
jgi:hypothetical protein